MKKSIFSFVCALLFSVVLLCGCKSTTLQGKYAVSSLSCMGLTATKESFAAYSKSRTEIDQNNNALFKPIYLLFNLNLSLNEDGSANLVIKDFKSTLKNDDHYSRALNSAIQKGYVKNNDLEISDLRWSIDKSQSNTYFVFAIDQDGMKVSLSDIWGNSLFSCDYIHARIENGKLACKIKVCVYEKETEEKSSVTLTTNVTIIMNKI